MIINKNETQINSYVQYISTDAYVLYCYNESLLNVFYFHESEGNCH